MKNKLIRNKRDKKWQKLVNKQWKKYCLFSFSKIPISLILFDYTRRVVWLEEKERKEGILISITNRSPKALAQAEFVCFCSIEQGEKGLCLLLFRAINHKVTRISHKYDHIVVLF